MIAVKPSIIRKAPRVYQFIDVGEWEGVGSEDVYVGHWGNKGTLCRSRFSSLSTFNDRPLQRGRTNTT